MNSEKRETKVKFDLNLEPSKSIALEVPNRDEMNKIFFVGTLAHSIPENKDLPIANANGETFLATAGDAPDFANNAVGLKGAVGTVIDSYIDLLHEEELNLGHIKEAEFKEEKEDEAPRIDFVGVLHKNLLENYDISKADLKSGEFSLSMECLYTEWYYLHGGEIVKPNENKELEEYVGRTYKGKGVVRVIVDPEFAAVGLIPTGGQADREALIKSVAKKDDNNDEGSANMYKEFETEAEFEEFKEDLKEELLEGYAKIDEVLDKFSDLDLEDAENLDSLVESVASIKEDYEEKKEDYQELKKEKIFAERKQKLDEVDVNVEEEDKEEIVSMSKKAFSMLVESNKGKLEKTKASKEDGKEDDEDYNFDPNDATASEDEDVNLAQALKNM